MYLSASHPLVLTNRSIGREKQMYETIYTAERLNHHRAAQLTRESELIRAQREHARDATERPTGFAVVTEWFAHMMRHRRPIGAATA